MSKSAARTAQVLKLKLRGQTVDEIARTLAISVSAARRYVRLALDQLRGDVLDREDLQLLEAKRLDNYLQHIEEQIESGSLAALDRALRIQERRSNLLGLDAPKKSQATIEQTTVYANLSDDELRRRIVNLQQQLKLIPDDSASGRVLEGAFQRESEPQDQEGAYDFLY